MQHLDLSDEEAAALIKELADITGSDRYPFSRRIQTLRAILLKLRPEPAREPAPPGRCTRRREQLPPEGDDAGEIRARFLNRVVFIRSHL
jgi:hypothetical protein